jgi:hypothetical protein
MKLSIIQSTALALAFTISSLIPANTECAARTAQPNQKIDPMTEVYQVLEECLFLRANTRTVNKPFSYFVDKLVEIVTTNANYFKSYGANLVETFKQDMNSIRNEKNGIKVGKVLVRYKQFMPDSMKSTNPLQLLKILKKRLAIQDDGSVDEAVEQSTTTMERIVGFIVSIKEYFSK